MPHPDKPYKYEAALSEQDFEALSKKWGELDKNGVGKLRFVPDEHVKADPTQMNRIEAKLDQLLELHGRPQSVIILADPQIDRIAAELKGG